MSRTSTLAVAADTSRTYAWPDGFPRVPDEAWAHAEPDLFGRQYDSVDGHGWYKNLEPTVAQVLSALPDDGLLLDYSCGTGILARRILARADRRFGVLNVDASPKFLRIAVDTLGDDPRVAFRLQHLLKQERRLESLDEAVDADLLARGVDVLTSTNAIHLYYDLEDTLASWHRAVRPGGHVFVCSGNLRNPQRRPGDWIIDETVAEINEIAAQLVRDDPTFAEYRDVLDDAERMTAYRRLREKVFVPVRPLELYLSAFERSGFSVQHVYETTVFARVDEWYQLLAAYSDGVLGWIGGSKKVDGREPTATALEHRLSAIRTSLATLFPDRESFPCSWTYLTCRH